MSEPPRADDTDVAALDRLLDELHAAAARSDGPAYFELFTEDAVFIGTDVRERWSLAQFRARSEPIFADGRGWFYAKRDRRIIVGPPHCGVAWFDEVLDSRDYGTSRGTGVLLRTVRGWKVAQYALAHPIPNDVGKEVLARIQAFEASRIPVSQNAGSGR